MVDLTRLADEEAIRARVGDLDVIDLCSRQNRTPMTAFMEAAETDLGGPTQLSPIDDGLPGHFCLQGDDHLAVVFHSRALTLGALARNLLIEPALSSVRAQVAEQVALRVIAEVLLQRGFVDQALQTFAQSVRTRNVSIIEPDVMDLEYAALGESYLATWFFGLGHEIGHGLERATRSALIDSSGLSIDRVKAILDDMLRMSPSYDRVREIVEMDQASPSPRSYASPRLIQEEAICDLFALLALLRSAPVILGAPDALNAGALLAEVAIAVNGLMMVESCRRMANWFGNVEEEGEQQHMLMSSMALNTRLDLLWLTVLADDVDLLAKRNPEIRAFAGIGLEALTEWVASVNDASAEAGRGLQAARRFLSSREMRNPDLFYNMVGSLRNDAGLAMETRRFVHTARLLKKRSRELDLLAAAVA